MDERADEIEDVAPDAFTVVRPQTDTTEDPDSTTGSGSRQSDSSNSETSSELSDSTSDSDDNAEDDVAFSFSPVNSSSSEVVLKF